MQETMRGEKRRKKRVCGKQRKRERKRKEKWGSEGNNE